ncbi:MAG: SUMF1/EgtB/PvdO family nonheme iron enzyme [Magnetococcales bacterium]|nr:SUMF1/EgtB/PvdO family nonheme iron enzyme [Magnetococcales bacterium]
MRIPLIFITLLLGGCLGLSAKHTPQEPSPEAIFLTLDRGPLKRNQTQETPPPPIPRKSFATQSWRDIASGIPLVFVAEGCFTMGSSQGKPHEQPPHKVCLDSFWIGSHEVTQGQWHQVMGSLPTQIQNGVDLPIGNISWNEVQTFINRLNSISKGRFRLPTEAEWEFACRNRGAHELYCGNGTDPTSFAWFNQKDGTLHNVGGLKPNGLGLYDMNGNVWEWVNDWYTEDYYQHSPTHNPPGPDTNSNKVFRGGGLLSSTQFLRASTRAQLWPDRKHALLGVRLAGTPPP